MGTRIECSEFKGRRIVLEPVPFDQLNSIGPTENGYIVHLERDAHQNTSAYLEIPARAHEKTGTRTSLGRITVALSIESIKGLMLREDRSAADSEQQHVLLTLIGVTPAEHYTVRASSSVEQHLRKACDAIDRASSKYFDGLIGTTWSAQGYLVAVFFAKKAHYQSSEDDKEQWLINFPVTPGIPSKDFLRAVALAFVRDRPAVSPAARIWHAMRRVTLSSYNAIINSLLSVQALSTKDGSSAPPSLSASALSQDVIASTYRRVSTDDENQKGNVARAREHDRQAFNLHRGMAAKGVHPNQIDALMNTLEQPNGIRPSGEPASQQVLPPLLPQQQSPAAALTTSTTAPTESTWSRIARFAEGGGLLGCFVYLLSSSGEASNTSATAPKKPAELTATPDKDPAEDTDASSHTGLGDDDDERYALPLK